MHRSIWHKDNKAYAARGVTLIEIVVGIAIFSIISAAVYQSVVLVQRALSHADALVSAAALANERLEIIRGLPYEDVGISGGFPDGVLEKEETIIRSGWTFNVVTTIRNIDDPSFGPEGAANYKLAQVDIDCTHCRSFSPISFSTYVAPHGKEDAHGGGLFIQVFNASGAPLAGADVVVRNDATTPQFVIHDTTGNDGILRLVGLPPGVEVYSIVVTGGGYSTDRTYGEEEFADGSIPLKPHATVVAGQVTAISFAIDKTSTLNISVKDDMCEVVPNIGITVSGFKIIGEDPTMLKYSETHQMDQMGSVVLRNMEWDDYTFLIGGTAWSLIGTDSAIPFLLAPDAVFDGMLIVRPYDPNSLLVSVTNAVTGELQSGATVIIEGEGQRIERITGEAIPLEDIEDEEDELEPAQRCAPPGQAYFEGLDLGTYSIEIVHDGHTSMSDTITINDPWQRYDISLQPD